MRGNPPAATMPTTGVIDEDSLVSGVIGSPRSEARHEQPNFEFGDNDHDEGYDESPEGIVKSSQESKNLFGSP